MLEVGIESAMVSYGADESEPRLPDVAPPVAPLATPDRRYRFRYNSGKTADVFA